MISPIGGLYLDAAERAKTKTTRAHISTAKGCTCEVSVSWFTTSSHSTRFSPCAAHKPAQPAKRGR